MYCNFFVTHPLPLILLPNESLVQMLSNVCFMACSSVPHSQVLLQSTLQISPNMVKNMAMHNGKRVLHNVIYIYIQ